MVACLYHTNKVNVGKYTNRPMDPMEYVVLSLVPMPNSAAVPGAQAQAPGESWC